MPPSSKFADIDFSKMPVERVTPDLSGLGQGFRCSRGEFVTYWRQGRIQREIDARISQCWILRSEDSLAGYVTLIADKLDLDQPILIDEGVRYQTFPAIKIGLLAADKRAKGAGRRLVEWSIEYVASEIAPAIGVRFLTVDALYDEDMTPPYDASGFYQKFGFLTIASRDCLIMTINSDKLKELEITTAPEKCNFCEVMEKTLNCAVSHMAESVGRILLNYRREAKFLFR